MGSLAWSSDMSTDIPILDSAHQRFLRNLSDIACASETDFIRKYFFLILELEHDFREEEELMEANRFYEISPHREQHARVLEALHKVVPEVLIGNFTQAKQTLELSPKWFLFHLSTMDRLLSIWFKLKTTNMTLETYADDQHHMALPLMARHRESPATRPD